MRFRGGAGRSAGRCSQGVTVTGGAAGPLARVGAGRRWAGQQLAGHGAVEAEAAAAGVVGLGEVLLVADGDPAPGPRAARGGGCSQRASVSGGVGGVGREAAEGVSPEKWRGVRLLPGHCGQHSPGNRSGSGQGKGGQRRAGHCTSPLCRWTRPGQVSGRRWRRPLPFSPSPWRTSPGLPKCPPHSSFPSRWQTHQTATQAAGVRGVGEVCSVGVLFPSKGTAWGRGELWAWERPPFPQGMLPSQP